MGLYESELNKQIYLRNKQKKEWEVMKKKIELAEEKKKMEEEELNERQQQQQREEDRIELEQTNVSKKLVANMVENAQGISSETLLKVVEVLQNQNGKKCTILGKLRD